MSGERRLADRLRIYRAAVPGDICAAIVAAGDALAASPGRLYDNATGERYHDAHERSTSVAWIAHDWMFDLVHAFAGSANADWGFDLTGADDLQYAIYRRNDFFETHKDMLRVREGPIRKVSVVVQLSAPEAYRGGRLEFLDDDFGLVAPASFAPQGSVAVFASLLKHRVTPIKEGERRSLTAWFKGPPFR